MIIDMGRTFAEELVYLTNQSTEIKKEKPKVLNASPELIQQKKFISFVEQFHENLIQVARKKAGSVKVEVSPEIQTLVYNVTKLSFETWIENIVTLDIFFIEESTEYTLWKIVWDKDHPVHEENIRF